MFKASHVFTADLCAFTQFLQAHKFVLMYVVHMGAALLFETSRWPARHPRLHRGQTAALGHERRPALFDTCLYA